MAKKSAGATKVSKKKVLSEQDKARRKFERGIRSFFDRLGFVRVKSDGKQITFKGRTGELDDLFFYENIIVVAEYTAGQSSSEHVSKKSLLWDLIRNNVEEWTDFIRKTFPDAGNYVDNAGYDDSEFRVAVCYFSTETVSEEVEKCLGYARFFDQTRFRYFDALARTIQKSAKFELFKYLELEFKEVGAEIKNSAGATKVFNGLLLPEGHSSFPKGFKIVSFYADPSALLTMAYVLRRDSWRDPEGVYQRVLMKVRMAEMRKYLTTQGRVFVNNIIVTLPNETALNDGTQGAKNLSEAQKKEARPISVGVPYQSNSIGIVDGQHRVFCYHEGVDVHEKAIKKLRERQNLLVTGLVYPDNYTDAEKSRFEARLFLEINDKQKRAKSDLKQSIELLLSPLSNVAIAKRIVQRLNSSGALKGLLQTNYFDPPSFIRTTSIVSYGLRPLVKLDGTDSLFRAWQEADKEKLRDAQKAGGESVTPSVEKLLESYVEFCVDSINALLIAAKKRHGSDKWKLKDRPKDRILTPTLINGLVVCMRLLVEHKKLLTSATYEAKLIGMDQFAFHKFRSSHWRKLGQELYDKFFG